MRHCKERSRIEGNWDLCRAFAGSTQAALSARSRDTRDLNLAPRGSFARPAAWRRGRSPIGSGQIQRHEARDEISLLIVRPRPSPAPLGFVPSNRWPVKGPEQSYTSAAETERVRFRPRISPSGIVGRSRLLYVLCSVPALPPSWRCLWRLLCFPYETDSARR